VGENPAGHDLAKSIAPMAIAPRASAGTRRRWISVAWAWACSPRTRRSARISPTSASVPTSLAWR